MDLVICEDLCKLIRINSHVKRVNVSQTDCTNIEYLRLWKTIDIIGAQVILDADNLHTHVVGILM